MRYIINPVISILMVLWAASPIMSASIPIENHSFELPIVDPNISSTLPDVNEWTEIDSNISAGTNTGVLTNTTEDG